MLLSLTLQLGLYLATICSHATVIMNIFREWQSHRKIKCLNKKKYLTVSNTAIHSNNRVNDLQTPTKIPNLVYYHLCHQDEL